MKLLSFKGTGAIALTILLSACNPFAAINDAANAVDNATNTGSNVSCNTGYTSVGSAQCITYTSATPVTSCSFGTQVSSCSGVNQCVYDGAYTFYYDTYSASTQNYCTSSGGTWL